MPMFDNKYEKRECIQAWKNFVILLIICLIVHNVSGALNDATKAPPPPAQIINSIKISNPRISNDIIDKFFRVTNIKGTAENTSNKLKSNIVIIVELQDKNGIKIGTKEIKISSLAPSEKYKINEYIWNNEVKAYKLINIICDSY